MTSAALWLAVCGTRTLAGYPSLPTDPWCRRLLSEVAGPEIVTSRNPDAWYAPEPAGRDGWKWTFADGSAILANSEMAVVL